MPLERLVFEVGEALSRHDFVLANGTNQRFGAGLADPPVRARGDVNS